MDPDANLKEQLGLARSLVNDRSQYPEYDGARLAELVIALHEWRVAGGFDPYSPQARHGSGGDRLPT